MSESRKTKRRETERRLSERRIILFAFGSDEWCRMIRREYLLWPKKDRRDEEGRRSLKRRKVFRRDKNSVFSPRKNEATQNLNNLLTNEEREMINDLIRSG